MNLSDFIDFDRQLHLDPSAKDAAGRLERDRRIGRALSSADASGAREEERLLLGWKNDVAAEGSPSLGALVAAAVRWTAFCLLAIGLIAGAAAAAALLRYDGTQPINVLFFLGAIVGVQLLLIPLLVLTFLFRRRLRRGWRLARDLAGGLFEQVLALLARFGESPEKAARLRADLGALRAGNSLYARVQPVVALWLIQVFGVAFNIAVAATLLFFVVFSDLTFSWGTTVQVEPERIHRIVSVLSAPWAGWIPQARPSLELVETTRFVRMEGAYVSDDPDAALRAGGWWPFLFVATIAYGLLPRLLALVASSWILRRERRAALANSSRVQALKERLRTPLVRVEADSVEEDVPPSGAEREPSGPDGLESGLSLAVVFWAYDEDPPEPAVSELLKARLGATAAGRFRAGGVDSGEDAVLENLKNAKREERIAGAAVFFEPFEPPKTDALRFLTRLRGALGPSAPIVALLAEFEGARVAPVEPGDWSAWNHAIRSMGDPYLLIGKEAVSR